ncbi:MAG: prepilin-type N-terminal cleavage/methylation domain-containing protein [Desulfobacteraceae bacterium]|jgi:general secretion pathway protein G
MPGNGLKKGFLHALKRCVARADRVVHRIGSALMAGLLKMSREEVAAGFTLVELLVVVAMLGTLSGIGIPAYTRYIDKARITKAIAEITMLQNEIKLYEIGENTLPNSLADIGWGTLLDPYGNPYQYVNFATGFSGKGVGGKRKDQWDNPLNDDYDLYSTGKDGESAQHLHNKKSHDDIIRAREGRFIGLASEF